MSRVIIVILLRNNVILKFVKRVGKSRLVVLDGNF